MLVVIANNQTGRIERGLQDLLCQAGTAGLENLGWNVQSQYQCGPHCQRRAQQCIMEATPQWCDSWWRNFPLCCFPGPRSHSLPLLPSFCCLHQKLLMQLGVCCVFRLASKPAYILVCWYVAHWHYLGRMIIQKLVVRFAIHSDTTCHLGELKITFQIRK